MTFIYPILTIAGGLIAASSLIIARKPNAKEFFAKVAPYQGFLGLGLLAMAVLWSIRVVPQIGGLLQAAPFAAATTIGALAVNALIGFLLGFGLLSKFALSKSDAAKEKAQRLLVRIARVQVPLGLAAVVLGVLVLV